MSDLWWKGAVLALAIALIGFLTIDQYVPRVGFIGNLVHAKISLTKSCDSSLPREHYQDQRSSLRHGDCGVNINYSSVLIVSIAIAAVALVWPRH